MNRSTEPSSAGDCVVRVKSVTPQRLVVSQMLVSAGDWGLALAKILEDVWKFLNTFDDVTVGPPMARLHSIDAGTLRIEAGFPVAQKLGDVEPFLHATLPACEAATLLMWGPYERLPEAQAKLDDWIVSEKRHAESSPWLIFWATPDDVQFPSELRTELVLPLTGDSSQSA